MKKNYVKDEEFKSFRFAKQDFFKAGLRKNSLSSEKICKTQRDSSRDILGFLTSRHLNAIPKTVVGNLNTPLKVGTKRLISKVLESKLKEALQKVTAKKISVFVI